ncbi:MAG: restriction endonuclease subunit S [Anaerolineae bacterium]
MDERNDLPQLPKGWVWTRLGDIVGNVEKTDPHVQPDREFDYIDIASIDNTQQKITSPKKYLGKDAPSRARQVVKTGDVLFSTVRTYLKNIAAVPSIFDGQIASTGFCVIRPADGINHIFIFLLTQTNDFLNPLNDLQRGTSYPAVRDSDVFSQFVPIPPLPEQRRIVAKIEELFSDLDAGIAELQKAKAQLKRYRQAVLKAAVEGKLTTEWREANKGKIEPASVLLERIREERAKQGNGKEKTLPPVNTRELGELPEGWCWATWKMILANEAGAFRRGPFGSALTKSIFVESGYKVYEQYCAINDDCSFGRYYITPEKFEEMRAFEVNAGDYLMSCSGVTLGRITRVPQQFERGIINQALLRIRINENIIAHRYFLHLFRSPRFQKSLFDNSTGTAIPNVKGVKELRAISFPLPSLTEQEFIVAEVERRLSVADEVEKTVAQGLKQAERLRQSILKRAFEGKLVPQDPSDEPAERLLEKIRASRAEEAEKINQDKPPKQRKENKQLKLI